MDTINDQLKAVGIHNKEANKLIKRYTPQN